MWYLRLSIDGATNLGRDFSCGRSSIFWRQVAAPVRSILDASYWGWVLANCGDFGGLRTLCHCWGQRNRQEDPWCVHNTTIRLHTIRGHRVFLHIQAELYQCSFRMAYWRPILRDIFLFWAVISHDFQSFLHGISYRPIRSVYFLCFAAGERCWGGFIYWSICPMHHGDRIVLLDGRSICWMLLDVKQFHLCFILVRQLFLSWRSCEVLVMWPYRQFWWKGIQRILFYQWKFQQFWRECHLIQRIHHNRGWLLWRRDRNIAWLLSASLDLTIRWNWQLSLMAKQNIQYNFDLFPQRKKWLANLWKDPWGRRSNFTVSFLCICSMEVAWVIQCKVSLSVEHSW